MTPKRKISSKDPSYYIPLPFAMAVKRTLNDQSVLDHLFEGMVLHLKPEGIINVRISVVANIGENEVILGFIPKGMVSRVEGLLGHEHNVCFTLERLYCNRLKNSFWICIDELPPLPNFGL